MHTTALPAKRDAATRTPASLTRLAAGIADVHVATAWLLADAVAAVGFAAGLAGALVAVAGQGSDLAGWLSLAIASAMLRGVVSMLAVRTGSRAAAVSGERLRRRIVRASLAASRARSGAHETAGTLMSLAVDEVEASGPYVSRYLPSRRAAVLAPLVVLVAIGVASPVAAALLAATLPVFVTLMALVGKASATESHRQFAALARVSGLFVDRLRALPVILAFDARRRETRRLADAAEDLATRTMKILRMAFLSSAVLEFFAALSVAIVAVYAGFNLLGLLPFPVPEKLDLGRAFFVLALAPEFFLPLRRLAAAYHDRQSAETAVERVARFEGDRAADAAHAKADDDRRAKAPLVRFDRVELRHVDASAAFVRDLSFDVASGQVVALVGPSGCGKTSVLRALLGLMPVAAGTISVDGLPIGLDGGMASRAAWIGQSPLIVPGTLRGNLRLAAPAASEDDLVRVCMQAGLGPLLRSREGIDTPIDPRGSGLSGGERRRIALARALLKSSDVWLLDEPTAHLDAASEDALIAALVRHRAGRTTIIATHSERLAAIADRVVSLEAFRP